MIAHRIYVFLSDYRLETFQKLDSTGRKKLATAETGTGKYKADNIPLYPGLPEEARIGEIPPEEEELFDTVYVEVAA